MKDFIYYNNLFDIYGDLLTEKEKDNFKDYYEEDLSLAEIADNKNISRSAVQKMLKNVLDKLNYYESSLRIYEKKLKLSESLKINDINSLKEEIKRILN